MHSISILRIVFVIELHSAVHKIGHSQMHVYLIYHYFLLVYCLHQLELDFIRFAINELHCLFSVWILCCLILCWSTRRKKGKVGKCWKNMFHATFNRENVSIFRALINKAGEPTCCEYRRWDSWADSATDRGSFLPEYRHLFPCFTVNHSRMNGTINFQRIY